MAKKNKERKHNIHSTRAPECKPATSSGAPLKQQQSVPPWRGNCGEGRSGKIKHSTQNCIPYFMRDLGSFSWAILTIYVYSSFLSTLSKPKKSLKNSFMEELSWLHSLGCYLWSLFFHCTGLSKIPRPTTPKLKVFTKGEYTQFTTFIKYENSEF